MSVLSVIWSTRSGILAGFLLSAEFLNQCDIFFQSLDEYLFQSFSWLFRGEGACLLLCYKVRLPQNCPLLTPPLWFYPCAFKDMQEWHMSNCRFGTLGLLLTDGLCVKAICWDPSLVYISTFSVMQMRICYTLLILCATSVLACHRLWQNHLFGCRQKLS